MPGAVTPQNSLQTQFGAMGYLSQNTGQSNTVTNRGGYMESVAELGRNPDGSMNTRSKLEALKPYFGAPQRQVQEDAYAWWDTETYDLPDAFKGKNSYMLNILITAILTSEMTPITEMLPYKKSETGLTIEWDIWMFNDALLERTPEESVSRMTTNTTTSYAEHLVRRGKAFMLEHGFWMTAKGQKNWAMNIIQIVNATTETACFGATHAVLTATPYVDPNSVYGSRRERGLLDVDSLMMEQTDSFARIQKEEGGLATTLRKMDETFRNRNGHQANYLILPSGCDIVLQNRPENNYAIYNGRGPTNPTASQLGPWTTRVSRGYRIGEHSPNVDPHFATVCIGGFHVLTAQAANIVPIAEYQTSHRTIVIFSMSKDDFTPMELPYVFGYLGLYEGWNQNQNQSSSISRIGRMFLSKYGTWGKLLDAAGEKQRAIDKLALLTDDGYDMFMSTFGQRARLLRGAAAVDLVNSDRFSLMDGGQSAVSGRPDQRSVRKQTRMEALVEPLRYINDPTQYLQFIGNSTISCSNSIQKVATGAASDWYDLSSRMFVHFDIRYSELSTPLVVHRSDKFQLDPMYNTKNACARAQLSIASSVLIGMMRYYASHKARVVAITDDALVSLLLGVYVKWLKATTDFSESMGGANLAQFFACALLKGQTRYTDMCQFGDQFKFPFIELIDLTIAIVTSPADADAIAHFKRIADVFLPRDQSTVSARVVSYTDRPSEAVVAVMSESNTLEIVPAAELAETEKKLVKFIIDIKALTEAELLRLAGSRSARTQDEKVLLLDGFRSKLLSFILRIGRLRLVTTVQYPNANATDAWYVNLLVLMTKLANRTVAGHLIDDVTLAMSKKPHSRKSTIAFIAPPGVPIRQADGGLDKNESMMGATFFDSPNLNEKVNAYIETLKHTDTSVIQSIDHVKMTPHSRSEHLLSTSRRRDINEADAAVDASDYGAIKSLVDDFEHAGDCEAARYSAKLTKDVNALCVAQPHVDEFFVTLLSSMLFDPNMPPNTAAVSILRIILEPSKTAATPAITESDALTNSSIALFKRLLSNSALLSTLPGVRSTNQNVFEHAFRALHKRMQDRLASCDETKPAWGNTLPPVDTLLAEFTKVDATSDTWWRDKPIALGGGGGAPAPAVVEKRFSGRDMSNLLDGVPLESGDWAKFSFDNHIPFPLGAIGFRLHKQYDMGTAVMMDAYGQAGYTYFGFADFQLGDDVGKKIHVAHFTLYLKSMVQNPKLIVYARYVISRGYFGGEGTKVWDPLEEEDVEDFHSGRMNKDILYAPILSNYRTEHNVLDVTGRFPPSMMTSAAVNANIQYESADIMRRVWHLAHAKKVDIELGCTQPLHQTLAMQEHTQTWNHQKKGYTDVTLDKGHCGKSKYSGCAVVLKGDGRVLERSVHDQTKTMTIGV